jgi:hypothetical protein
MQTSHMQTFLQKLQPLHAGDPQFIFCQDVASV